jgi:hypothetical protein
MTTGTGPRGQPLLLFGAVLIGWLALRIALWESPFAARLRPSAPEVGLTAAFGAPIRSARKQKAAAAHPVPMWREAKPGRSSEHSSSPDGRFVARSELPAQMAPSAAEPPPSSMPPVQRDLPQSAIARGQSAPKPPRFELPAPSARTSISRWSADGWLLLRRDGAPGVSGPILAGRPGYGRSQAGAVVRYDLAPGSAARPRVHLRVAAALAGSREREIATGVSLRPLPAVPVRAVVEARVSETETGTHVRPAAYGVTEMPPLALPHGLRAEAYVQGGYIGGDFATPFVDGQARAERVLARVGDGELSAGAGAWGGAQKGSSRLDIGPTAAIEFRLGAMRGRLAADYRLRIAGKAEPASGPALTVSAGF